jgi:hypothetical protein
LTPVLIGLTKVAGALGVGGLTGLIVATAAGLGLTVLPDVGEVYFDTGVMAGGVGLTVLPVVGVTGFGFTAETLGI